MPSSIKDLGLFSACLTKSTTLISEFSPSFSSKGTVSCFTSLNVLTSYNLKN